MDRVLCLLIDIIIVTARFTKMLSRLGIGSYEEWQPGRKLKILLVGYNGARNTGSDVRVVSIARQVKELFGADKVQLTVMTLDKKTLEGYFDSDVTLYPFSSFYPWHLFRACCSHHAAILCEGSTLKSTFANALTLFMCEAAGIMAAQKKPCLAFGAEVGQMEPFLARAVSRQCKDAYFITRTQGSFDALLGLGLKGHVGTDAAWLYDQAISPETARQLLMDQGWDGKKPLLGIAVINPFCWPVRASLGRWLAGRITGNLSGQYDKWYFFSDSPDRRRAYRRYIGEISRGLKMFLKEHDYFPVLLGMERLDEKACRAVGARLGRESAMFLSGMQPASVMTGVLRQLSALVTSRYHAAVLSMEKGCPVVAVSMDERLDGIMKEMSFDTEYLFHVRETGLGGKIYRALGDAAAHEDSIRRTIADQLALKKQMQHEMGVYLKQYFTSRLS